MVMKATQNVPTTALAHRNNCAIVATGLPYEQVFSEFVNERFYNPRQGTTTVGQMKWLRDRGFTLRSIIGLAGKTLTQTLAALPKDRVFLIYTTSHCQALVRGKHVNTSARARCRVHMIYEVMKFERPMPALVKALFELGTLGAPAQGLARLLNLEVRQVRAQIDRARRAGWKIINRNGKFFLDLG